MISPILALRRSVVAYLNKNQKIGPLKDIALYDQVPSGARGLYMTFGDSSAIDLSFDEMERHYDVQFSLIVWSTSEEGLSETKNYFYGASKRALEVSSYLIEALHSASLRLPEHELIFIRSSSEKLTRDISTGSARVEIWFHAMTEYKNLKQMKESGL